MDCRAEVFELAQMALSAAIRNGPDRSVFLDPNNRARVREIGESIARKAIAVGGDPVEEMEFFARDVELASTDPKRCCPLLDDGRKLRGQGIDPRDARVDHAELAAAWDGIAGWRR
jgi:hypothetical protein